MVNTFLPFPSFKYSLKVLDDRRCGKQRVEARQIIDALVNGTRWQHHPAAKMWIGYENALIYYYNLSVDEWISRGKNNTMKKIKIVGNIVYPWWLGWSAFHDSHKTSLLRKNPYYYGDKFKLNDNMMERGYLWPSKLEENDVVEYYSRYKLTMFEKINSFLYSDSWFSPVGDVRVATKDSIYTLPQLRDMAKANGLKGYHKLKKLDLMEKLGIS